MAAISCFALEEPSDRDTVMRRFFGQVMLQCVEQGQAGLVQSLMLIQEIVT